VKRETKNNAWAKRGANFNEWQKAKQRKQARNMRQEKETASIRTRRKGSKRQGEHTDQKRQAKRRGGNQGTHRGHGAGAQPETQTNQEATTGRRKEEGQKLQE
jgi:hypothetical protein